MFESLGESEKEIIPARKQTEKVDKELVSQVNNTSDALNLLLSDLSNPPNSEELQRLLSHDLPSARAIIQEEQSRREAAEEQLAAEFKKRVQVLQGKLEDEKVERQSEEEQILEMIKSMALGFEEKIQTQVEERGQNEENLLGLVEQVVERLKSDLSSF